MYGLTLCVISTGATRSLVTEYVQGKSILHRRGQGLPGLTLLVWVLGVHLLPCLMAPDLAGVPHTGCANLIQPPTNCLSREQAAAPRPRAGGLEQSSGHLRLPTAQLSLPLHAHVVHTMWLGAAPTPNQPGPAGVAGSSFHRNSALPGAWCRPARRVVGGLCGPRAQPAVFHSEFQLAAGFRSPSPPTPSGRAPSPDNHRAKAWQHSQLRVPLSLQTTFQTLSCLVLYEAGRRIKSNLWGRGQGM